MKQMIYQADRKCEVLHSGEYKGYKFAILSLGTHPTAYVENKNGYSSYDQANEKTDYCPHGGFTYIGNAYWDDYDNVEYLGWDYAHYNDFIGYAMVYKMVLPELCSNGKKWTTEEIFEDMKNVITILNKENQT